MFEQTVKFCWLRQDLAADWPLPDYATTGAAGMDIRAAVVEKILIQPGEIRPIPTGFAVEIPEGFEIQVRPRSGLAVRHGITLVNSPGTIDSDFRGEVKVPLINHGQVPFLVNPGDRIAQMVLSQVVRMRLDAVAELEPTARGDGGFGHTGV
ncbi:MAG: dUTP diphosphatase [Deltaproteobacteria bacterium]|nr:MAG: dUTP diphosphatase [Deltaproteobacteria bacterium]